ncbi:MAG: hypothetical protein AAF985_07365 [Bacteroidota bacterium]
MKTIIGLCLLASISFTYLACSQSDEISNNYELGEMIELRVGEKASLANTDILLNFMDIAEDSRCPDNDDPCIWEGRAIAAVQLHFNEETYNLNLISRSGFPQKAEQQVNGRTFRLVNVSPYPSSPQAIDKGDYIISLVVE